MENIDIIIFLLIAVIILSFLLPFVLWTLNLIDKSKLSRINTFEEFKEKMRIMALRKWLKPNVTLTNREIIREVIKELVKKEKLFQKLKGWPIKIPIYSLYIIVLIKLFSTMLRYYVRIKTGYEFPIKFPIAEALLIVALSLWMSAFLFSKLGNKRINMFLEKLKELEGRLR